MGYTQVYISFFIPAVYIWGLSVKSEKIGQSIKPQKISYNETDDTR